MTQDNVRVRISRDGVFLLGFTRDAPKTSELEIVLPDGRRVTRTLKAAPRDYRIQRIDGLPEGKVTPRKPADIERIRRDSAAVGKVRKRDDDRQDFLDGFEWPVLGPITGVMGSANPQRQPAPTALRRRYRGADRHRSGHRPPAWSRWWFRTCSFQAAR